MITIPQKIQDYFRSLPQTKKDELALTRYGEDIWFTDYQVPIHTDNTEAGKNTVILVLINDASRQVWIDQYGNVAAFPGYQIRFDGNREHGLLGGPEGRCRDRFAAIIWDVPIDKSNNDIYKEMQERLDQLLTEVKQLQSQTIAVKQL